MGSGDGHTRIDVRRCASGVLSLALVAALSLPVWSAPTSLASAPDRSRYVVMRWTWSSVEDDGPATTPSLEEALRPSEFGYPRALDASALTDDVDGLNWAFESRSREYLSARAVAKLSQLLFHLTTETSTVDQAIEVVSVEWSAAHFSAAGGGGAFAGTGYASPGFENLPVGEPARPGGGQPLEDSANPLVRFVSSTVQYLRENREWVLGIAAGLLALAGLASSLHARR